MSTSNDSPQHDRPRRWFFALWPDVSLLAALDPLLDSRLPARAGRPVERHNLHITLVFLGTLDASQQDCARAAAGHCAGAPGFELVLDRLGWWRQSQVLWLGAGVQPPALDALVAALRERLVHCPGMMLDPRPYRAHMTLLRKVRRRPRSLQAAPLSWRPTEFVLVESEPLERGVRYHRRGAWPLT